METKQTYKYEEVITHSQAYFNNTELPASIWAGKYALVNNNDEYEELTPDDMHWRIAKEIARVEAKKFKKPLAEKDVYEYLKDFKRIIPQGSPAYGIGNYHQYVSLGNCFVLTSPVDSYGGILATDQELVQISKRRGGVGIDLSHIRPNKYPTKNSARKSTGIIPFAKRFSNSIREVGQENRRGALMLTLDVHHPEVEEFATCKNNSTEVTGANISIRLSDEFLQAVENNTDYEQRWPVDSKTPKFSRMVSARKVWKTIIRSAWERAEPGLLFWDMIKRESPADCYATLGFETVSTNPCGELPLSILDSCRLLVLNLFSYVVNPYTPSAYFDFKRFREDAIIAQRFMDDIVDLEIEAIDRIIEKIKNDPEDEVTKQKELDIWIRIRWTAETGRRSGTGITALGDTLAAVGIPYGSDESIRVSGEIYKVLKLACYHSSVDMAKELGPFPIWDAELEKDNPFLLRLREEDSELYEDMQKYGRRNIALLTTAPVGTKSQLAKLIKRHGTCSGVELMFTDKPYIRRKKINPNDKNTRVDFVDETGDKWQEYDVYPAGVDEWMEVTGNTDYTQSPYHGCTANDIDWRQRVKLQAEIQKHIDHSISSTVNLPNNATEEQVAEIYETAWRSGCKGLTIYRDGCRDGVLIHKDTKKEETIPKTTAPKRPNTIPCDIHNVNIKGKRYNVIVGLLKDEPYEVYVLETDKYLSLKTGFIKKEKRGVYSLSDKNDIVLENIAQNFNEHEELMTRMTSTALRHGADIAFVVHQLEKSHGDMYSLGKSMARALKKYIKDGTKVNGESCPDCQSEELIRNAGCVSCQCGWSKCS